MATLTNSKEQVLVGLVEDMLNAYEELEVHRDMPGVEGYVLTFQTHLYVHIKHTHKSRFVPHSIYSAVSSSVLPNKPFVERWLKEARIATHGLIQKGDYTNEKLVGGEWQSWKRKFNQWVYWDKKRHQMFGQVHTTNQST